MTKAEEVAKIINAFIDDASNYTTPALYAEAAKERFHEIKGCIQGEAEVGEVPDVPVG